MGTEIIQKFVKSQMSLSFAFDRLLPAEYRIDGDTDFMENLLPRYLQCDSVVYDVGGGKTPNVSSTVKRGLNLKITGVDIDPQELQSAPAGSYDQVVCADIANFKGQQDADIVICRAVLEHVKNTEAALLSLSSMLKPGGHALLFVPSRNALYARLNLILPEALKRALLMKIFPGSQYHQGYPAYYHRCTPKNLREMAAQNGLVIEEARYYFKSGYFSFFFPLYVIWRFWIILFRFFAHEQAAETFSLVLRKI